MEDTKYRRGSTVNPVSIIVHSLFPILLGSLVASTGFAGTMFRTSVSTSTKASGSAVAGNKER
jgi:hypothetical protein